MLNNAKPAYTLNHIASETILKLFNLYQERFQEFKVFLQTEGIIFKEERGFILSWKTEEKAFHLSCITPVLKVEAGNLKPKFISGKENIFNYLIG